MFDTTGDILTAVTRKEGEMSALRTRMDSDFSLLTMVPYESKDANGNVRKGYQTYTTSEPRNIFDKILDGLNRAVLTVAIQLPAKATKAERQAASQGELFLFGVLEKIDRQLKARGEPPLRESLGYYLCARGWCALRALVYMPKGDEDIAFDVVPWDPRHVTWEQGANGLLWAARKRRATAAQIMAEYGIAITAREADVIDFWDEKRNSVVVAGSFGKEPTEHNIGHVPVLVASVGSMPTMQGKDFEGTMEYRGDSVWTASRGTYEPLNKHISRLMDVHEAASVGSMVYKTEDGTKDLEGNPFQTFKVHKMKLDEVLEHIELPRAPQETGAILQLLSEDIARSNLPYPQAYGGTTQPLSGRALAYLGDQTQSVYTPRTGALADAYIWLAEELFTQFKNKAVAPVMMQGFQADDTFFKAKIQPKDISADWFIKGTVAPKLPRDEESEIQMGLAATLQRGPTDLPLVSKATARANILKLRDPDAEEDKVLEEMGKAMPPILGARIANAMKERGDDEGAELVMAWLASQGQGSPPPGQGVSPNGAPAVPQANGQQPQAMQVIEAVLQTLEQMGAEQLAQALMQALQSGQAPPPELIDAIIQALVQAGQQALANAFLGILQGAGTGRPPAQPQVSPPNEGERLATLGLTGALR